ncbi:MAG: AMP-binding protein [Paludibacteraceae bacterium]|nr:AMP-binding protein [Paludibacteraceae bacterium]
MMANGFIRYFEKAIPEFWELPAMTDYVSKSSYTYQQVGEEIAKLHLLFEQMHIQPNDKVALVGRNTPQWAITFLATITYGAVIVPILQDFHPNDVMHIVNHSESKLLFLSDNQWENLEEEKMQNVRGVFSITDFRCVYQAPGETVQAMMKQLPTCYAERYPNGLRKEDVKYAQKDDEELAVLNYTSGTTGYSKGVMLTGENLCGNLDFAGETNLVGRGYRILTFLPLAHAYGCAFDFLAQIAYGAHITFLTKIPSPKVLLKAMEEVKPTAIFTVPLIIEKIYKNNILPKLNKTSMRLITNIPILSGRVYAEIRNALVKTFGGEFCQMVIGGAPINREVEDFLLKIKFPFSVGYGMTECGPLISFEGCDTYSPHSTGRVITGMEMRIDSADPKNVPGEIQVRGRNVMKGYYKNEEATAETFTADGWMRTGDIGVMDEQGFLYIKGRSKTMILGPSGQNIYPEEIEAKLNNLPFISESIVMMRNEKLVALVYPDSAAMDEMGVQTKDLDVVMETHRKSLNEQLAAYERLTAIIIHPTEFEKTPKKSIKRYLYEKA